MPPSARPHAIEAQYPGTKLPSIALCGEFEWLGGLGKKIKHEKLCQDCKALKAQRMPISGQGLPRHSSYGTIAPPVTASTESFSLSSVPSTPGLLTESTSSDASSVFDSRRSSVNVNGPNVIPAERLNTLDRSKGLTELNDAAQATKGQKKRPRQAMTQQEQLKVDSKNENEKVKRGELGAGYQTLQEVLAVLCRIDIGVLQAMSNARTSGLFNNKYDIHSWTIALLLYFIEKNIKAAIAKGDVNLHFDEMDDFAEDYQAKRAQGLPVTSGTLLDDGSVDHCRMEKPDLTCTTHDTPDKRDCQRKKYQRAFDYNVARLTEEQNETVD